MLPNYGSPPSADQLEVTLLGPGYGEAVVVHLGYGRWMLVDSCVSPGTKTAATSDYLQALGVLDDSIRVIVASHWHDDHVKGLSKLVERYRKAEFFIPGIFSRREAMQFLAAYSGTESQDLSRGTRELRAAIEQSVNPIAVKERVLVYEDNSAPLPVRVVAYWVLPHFHGRLS